MAKVNTILQGDVIERLQDIEDNTIQCVVTSPPYWGLRDYGEDEQLGLEETPEEYVENMVKVFREVRRALKDDGTLWLNLGDSYSSGGMSTTTNQTLRGNNDYGVTRPKPSENIKPKDLIGIPWRVAFALQQDGWYLRQDIIWHKPNPMPESVTDRCTKSHEYIFLLTKSANYYYDADAIREPHTWVENKPRPSGMSRNGKKYREKVKYGGGGTGFSGHSGSYKADGSPLNHPLGRNKRSVWKINTQPYKEAHFAVFPEKLPELCIKAGSKKGDIVLDPFFGSGTTGYVAQRLYRKWLGIELNPEYIKIANKRFVQQELFV
tara:strand:+ start:40 stop:1002 length:963 start_codon:yes stop_codon:yes gene_type:complete